MIYSDLSIAAHVYINPDQPSVNAQEEEDSGSLDLVAMAQTMYDVMQGSKKLQLQVGSMALQVFKGGKPLERYEVATERSILIYSDLF